ncbi:Cdc25 phosphatase Ibp1 [Balamuthia mandrillaris]
MEGFAIPPISIPTNFQRMTAEALADLLHNKKGSVAVIDVRDSDFIGGHIPGAINIPFDDLEEKMEALTEHANKEYVVFYCMYGQLRSPAAALAFIKAAKPPSKEDAEVPLASNTYVLVEGFRQWLKTFKGKENEMVENYDAECWNELLEHVHDQTPRSPMTTPK